jgi:ketosteroid isomerase-like protein
MEDAVARYAEATERNDVAALMATLTPDAVLISPLSAPAGSARSGRICARGWR